MRKQYHFRHSPRGLLAWDIDRLVLLSKDLRQRQVRLQAIRELEECYWYGGGAKPTCRDIAEHARLILETDLRHPIILCPEGRVMDGMHRVARAYIQGLDTIAAVQFEETPEPDYIGVDEGDLPYE